MKIAFRTDASNEIGIAGIDGGITITGSATVSKYFVKRKVVLVPPAVS